MTSGGVTIAAITNIATTAYFLTLMSEWDETKPTFPIKVNNTGS